MYMKKYINQYINNILLVSQTSMISIQFISVLVRDRDMNKLGEFQGKKTRTYKKSDLNNSNDNNQNLLLPFLSNT